MSEATRSGPPGAFRPPAGAPAGWYPDPYGQVYARYFDGYRWTPYTSVDRRFAGVDGRFAGLDGRFVGAEQEEHPALPFPVVVGAVVILFVSLVTQRQVIDAIVDRDWNVFVYMAISVVVGYGPSVAWMWYASRRWGTGRVFSDLGVRFRWVDLLWGPLICVTTIFAAGVTVRLLEAFDVPYRGNLEARTALETDRTAVVSFVIAAVIFAPIIEESLFRGVVMRGLLSKMGAPLAIAIQGVLFGAAHFNPDFGRESIGLVITLSVVGVGFGLGCFLLRRLGPVIIAHAVFNAVAIVVVLNRWN